MKRNLFVTALALVAIVTSAKGQNILNYSGKMYVSKMEVLTTPRYQSYEDHAILSTEMTVPAIEVTKVIFDFAADKVNMNNKDQKILSKSIKKYYTTDGGSEVVIYMVLDDGDKHELVWPQYGDPYMQALTPNKDGGVSIARMYLSTSPKSTSPEAALLQLLGGSAL